MAESVLVTRDLTKRYGQAAAVNSVNLNVEKGQIYGLVGRNGAGKTTIIRMISGQTVPSGGELELLLTHLAQVAGYRVLTAGQ